MAQTVNLNIIPKGIPDVVNASQYDVGRVIQFALYDGASAYNIPQGATVQIAGKKGDNHIFCYDETDGVVSWTGNTVTITSTQQMTAYAGEVVAQLRVIVNSTTLATVNFKMLIQARPDAEGDISETDIPVIVALATEQEQNAEAWAVGTKDGTAVSSSAPQYHNNSKYYKEQAATSATNAAASATAAAGSATNAAASEAAAAGYVYGIPNALSIDVDGNPIEGNFAAGAADKLIVDIQPIQDLHGYDYPWIGGAGKNKLPMTVEGIKAANTGGTWSGNVYTFNGFTFTILTDSDNNVIGINVNGNSTSRAYLYVGSMSSLIGQSVILNGCPSGGVASYTASGYCLFTGGSGVPQNYDTGSGVSYTVSEYGGDVIINVCNTSITNKIFYPMLRLSTESDSTFAPYSNECPISGLTEVGVDVEGKNLLDESVVGLYQATSDPSVKRYGYAPFILKKGTYTISYRVTSSTLKLFLTNMTDWSMTEILPSGTTVTLTSDTEVFLRSGLDSSSSVYWFRSVFSNAQIEHGSSATDYVPYVTPNTYTKDLNGTRYGGTLNVKTGVMTVAHAFIEYDGSEDENWTISPTYNWNTYISLSTARWTSRHANHISNQIIQDTGGADNRIKGTFWVSDAGNLNVGIYDKGGGTLSGWRSYLANNPLQICYELAAPLTVQLDPETVNLLKGYNHITSNGNTVMHLSAVPEKLINYIVNAFGTDESGRTTASRAYAAKEYFYKDGFMYKVTAPIAQNAAFTVGTNCVQTTIFAELTALNA